MDRYQRARDRTVTQIKAIQSFSGNINANTTLEAIQTRGENCEKLYKDFNSHELELLAFDTYTPITLEVDEIYFETMARLRAAINSRAHLNKPEIQDLNATLGQFIGQQQTFLQGMNQPQNARLPKINIEPFAGDYKLWPSFHDLYLTSVHENNGLSAVHKMQILNGLLRGDAAALIRHIRVTELNYEEAWSKLVSRYNKPKSIVCSLIQLFLEQKHCIQANHKELRRLCDTSDEVIRGLRALGDQAESRNPWLVHMLVSKLDADTKQLWAKESVNDAFPTFESLLKFLSTRCDALESCIGVAKPTGAVSKFVKSYHTMEANKWSCIACKQHHFLYKCPLFKSMNVDNRTKLIKQSNSCTNCLRTGHLEGKCFSRALCLICNKRHHSLLHSDQHSTNLPSTNLDPANTHSTNLHTTNLDPVTTTSTSTSNNSHQSINNSYLQATLSSQPSTNNIHTTSLHENQPLLNTLLPTALIYIQSSNGHQTLARALLDSGSQSSFITESCVQRLGLKRKYSHISINGLASCSAGKTRGKTAITIQSRVIPHYTLQITAHIIEKISAALPSTIVIISKSNEIWKLDLADPHFNQPSSVDILIGAELFLEILSEQKMYIKDLPVLHSSKFGWIIAGNIGQESNNHYIEQNFNTNSSTNDESVMKLLKRFWEVEEPLVNSTHIDKVELCETLFKTTTTRTTKGQFIVRLPFIHPRPIIGDSFKIAKARMVSLEKRLSKSLQDHKDYQAFMEEYIALGQMRKIPWSEVPVDNNLKYFMPHHAVYKESTTTKLRVVFDASCKSSSSISLNECLQIGTKLQPDLTTTLIRFRQNLIAINADIEKMYRQILVDPSDANFQLILWRKDTQEALSPYKCMTVTYGTACAPFLAIRTLEELANNFETIYPEAAKAVRNSFYMDDLLTGSANVEEAIILKNQIIEILNSGGFKLRKWKSNSDIFLQSLSANNIEEIPKLIEDDPTSKTLGIMWYPRRDMFSFKISCQPENVMWTKRKMLSESSKLYDPLGWLSPVIVCFKMMLQKLWLTKTDWDEKAPTNILDSWKKIYTNLSFLQQIQIPRCLLESSNPDSIQLHAFCDASESAYGGVVYLRSSNHNEHITCRLVCSKSKVAPIKQISLPRLELCGALLLSDLVKYCKTIFHIEESNVYAWTDSMIVLHWLSDHPARWKNFIANRTSTILDIIPRNQWNHVISSQNPADHISRGVNPQQLPCLESWWHGPSWLKQTENHWPKIKTKIPAKELDIEERKSKIIVY